MRIYEQLFIVKPNATDEEVEQAIDLIRQTVTSQGGTLDKVEKWGVRKLAYKVQKHTEGYYVLVQFSCGPQTIKEVERRLRVSDLVMRYLTVRIDERLKRLEKRRREREKRAARRPAPAAVPVAEEAAPVPGMPEPEGEKE